MIEVECVIKKNYKLWYIKGTTIFHREDGPAAIYYNVGNVEQIKNWYKYGILHREDGPAIEEIRDEVISSGYVLHGTLCKWPNGKFIESQEEFEKFKKLCILL